MMQSRLFTTRSFLLALVALVSISSIANGQTDSESLFDTDSNSTDCESITDILCNGEEDLSALCEAVSISELHDDLDEDTWTIFAPTNDAFEAIGRDNLDSFVLANDTVPLTDLLLFHIVPGVALTSVLLPCEAGKNLLEMANGEDSRTLCLNRMDPVEPIQQRGRFNDKSDAPAFVEMDIQACNGVIHKLDKVLLYKPLPYEIPEIAPPLETEGADPPPADPPTASGSASGTASTTGVVADPNTGIVADEERECPSIVDLACDDKRFSTLCTLIAEYGLADDLSGGLWTIFAPTNDAFNSAPPLKDDITFILTEHVIANAMITAEDLVCTEKTEMANGKKTRTVCKNGVTYQKGSGNSDEVRPEIIETNIEACNGIIHVVDQVILP